MAIPATEVLLPFLAIVAVAGYFQTVTGFGLGMILIGATSSLNLIPVAMAAAIINVLALANSAVALPGKLGHIDWRLVGAVLLAALPAIFVGLLLLELMSSRAAELLRLLLGTLIIASGISVALQSARARRLSGRGSFMVSGAVSGLFGGLFGIFGPPLIYQFYRQPLTLTGIRNMLILLFAVTATVRLLMLGVSGELEGRILTLSGLAIPVIAVATASARRFPPPVSARVMRAVVFLVLVGLGGRLVISATFSLVA